jgi:hypothetical protein
MPYQRYYNFQLRLYYFLMMDWQKVAVNPQPARIFFTTIGSVEHNRMHNRFYVFLI